MARLQGFMRYFPHGHLGTRVQMLPDRQLIYVKNPKAGTTTLLLWLHRLHHGDHGFEPGKHVRAELDLPRSSDIGTRTAVRMLNGAAYRFTFVRRPATRLESAYRHKIMSNIPRHRLEIERALGLPLGGEREITIDQFVESLMTGDPRDLNIHWRPQHLNLMHPAVTYDFIGRIESFDADLARLGETLDLPPIQMDVRNASPKVGQILGSRPDLVRKIETFYARDYELYGY